MSFVMRSAVVFTRDRFSSSSLTPPLHPNNTVIHHLQLIISCSTMSGSCRHLPYLALYIVSASLLSSRGATHWKLNENDGVVRILDSSKSPDVLKSDPILAILTKGFPNKEVALRKNNCEQCINGGSVAGSSGVISQGPTAIQMFPSPSLTCGLPVNETIYDHLEGIRLRLKHPAYAEPEVAMIFKKTELEDINLNDIEATLKQSYEESPNSVVVCNQIGNFWRIRGNSYQSIECFRKALSLSPNNADVLLNLARVLFNLNFHQDAVFLTRRSLESQPSDQNCWLQHFTLGEILKATGEFEEAGTHFRQALELNPSFHPAEIHLRDIGLPLSSATNTYTFLAIGLLLVIVLAVVYFMTLASDSKGPKSSKSSVWNDFKKPGKKKLVT